MTCDQDMTASVNAWTGHCLRLTTVAYLELVPLLGVVDSVSLELKIRHCDTE